MEGYEYFCVGVKGKGASKMDMAKRFGSPRSKYTKDKSKKNPQNCGVLANRRQVIT